MDIRTRILAAIDASGLNDRKLSVRATGGPDAVRNLRRGSIPRADNLERLCHAMGLELRITPAPKPPDDEYAAPAPIGPAVSTGNREVPVNEWTDPPEDGYRRPAEEPSRAPTGSFWKREDVVERGVVIASYRERPTTSKILEPHARLRPSPLADLWRSTQLSAPLKTAVDQLDKLVPVLTKFEKDCRGLSVTGQLSDPQARMVLRELASIVDERRERISDGGCRTATEAAAG